MFSLTETGKAELEAHAIEVEGFWARFEAQSVAQASRHEVAFLEEELESLRRTIWGGLSEAINHGDQETIRRLCGSHWFAAGMTCEASSAGSA